MTLDQLKAAVAAMTPGPWLDDGHSILSAHIPEGRSAARCKRVAQIEVTRDSVGIVALVNAAPALIECAELLRKADNLIHELLRHTRPTRPGGQVFFGHPLLDEINAALARLEGTNK